MKAIDIAINDVRSAYDNFYNILNAHIADKKKAQLLLVTLNTTLETLLSLIRSTQQFNHFYREDHNAD